jgi:hypothetical protein
MKKFKITAGIVWAFMCLILIIILFPGLNSFSSSASRLSFMRINPNYSGGEIAQKYITENCTVEVHKPVYDGLFKERKRGFVQVDWRGNLPVTLIDTIDYNLDNSPDFILKIDRTNSETELNPMSPKVRDVKISTPVSYGWAVRINLEK